MQIIIRSDRTIDQWAGKLKPERLRMALSVGINATVRQSKQKTAQEIARAGSIKRAKVEAGIRLRYATPGNLEGAIRGIGKPISLKDFGAKQGAKGVTATVWGKRQHYPGMFMGPSPGVIAGKLKGHAFVRTSRKRLPIEKSYGAGVAQVMSQAEIESMLRAYAAERLDKNIARQLQRYAWKG